MRTCKIISETSTCYGCLDTQIKHNVVEDCDGKLEKIPLRRVTNIKNI